MAPGGGLLNSTLCRTMYTYTGHAQIALNDPSKRSPSAADLGIRSVLHFIHLDFVGNSHAITIQTTAFKDKSY